VVKILH